MLDICAPGVAPGAHGGWVGAGYITGVVALAQDLAVDILGRRLTPDEFRTLLRETAVPIVDGDDEDDNVTNSGHTYLRVDAFALAEAISALAQKATQLIVYAGEPAGLASRHDEFMQGIVDASVTNPIVKTIVLADLPGPDSTYISIVHNGVVTSVVGLPDATGVLSPTLKEYQITDGTQLGGWLKWALDNYTDEDTKTVLSYYGHGTFLAPAVDLEGLLEQSRRTSSTLPYQPILPYDLDVFADFTDEYPRKELITPHAIQQMLEIGTNDGEQALDVLDLTHCFALSLEEVYEVSNDGASPYAEMVVGSPNYTYFDPAMAGAAVAALDPQADAQTMAETLINVYADKIDEANLVDGDSDVNHPLSLTVVDLEKIHGIKALFDELSYYLLREFNRNPIGTATIFEEVVRRSATYDTTYCKADWALDDEDALLDVGTFLPHLAQQFSSASGVMFRANQARALLDDAIVARRTSNGTPWMAAPNTPFWELDAYNTLGMSLFGDYIGQEDGTTRILSWHAPYYTDDIALNPHPYRFIQDSNGLPTWADVFNRYWEVREASEGLTLHTEGCLVDLPPVIEQGELAAIGITAPIAGSMHVGYGSRIKATMSTASAVSSPSVTITASNPAGIRVFTDTVSVGYLVTGTYEIESSSLFTPTTAGEYTVGVKVNSDGRIIEQDITDDNVTTTLRYVSPIQPFELDVVVATGQQWIQALSIPLILSGNAPLAEWTWQLFQYGPGENPGTHVPKLTHTRSEINPPQASTRALSPYDLQLPADLEVGPVILHIWGYAQDGRLSQEPAIVRFNYAPDASVVSLGQKTYYRLRAEANDDVSITLNIADGNAAMRVWGPQNRWSAQQIIGDGTIQFPSAYAGEYLVEIEGLDSTTTYNVSSELNGAQNRIMKNNDARWVGVPRPDFSEPSVNPPQDNDWHIFIPIVLSP